MRGANGGATYPAPFIRAGPLSPRFSSQHRYNAVVRVLGPEPVDREILLAFWKVHILHHASKDAVYGLWLVQELAEHGYRLNPGTLYPVLDRMERNGWLRSQRAREDHLRSRRLYSITPAGQAVLAHLRTFLGELHHEVFEEAEERHPPKPSARKAPVRKVPARKVPTRKAPVRKTSAPK